MHKQTDWFYKNKDYDRKLDEEQIKINIGHYKVRNINFFQQIYITKG